jgi:hypothetical protein
MSARKRSNPSNNNAFEMLMGKTPKSRKSSQKKSRFVDCPLECGAHVPEHQINQHLDSCLGGSYSKPSDNSDKETASKTWTPKADTVGQNKEDIDDAAVVSDKQKAVSGLQSNLKSTSTLHEVALSESRDSIKNSVAAAMIPVSQSPETNAFVHMMKQSQQVFSVKEPLRQRFHLHCDGHVTWTDTNDPSPDRSWSSTVLLKGSRMLRRESTGTSVGQPRDVELTISSSIPSEMSPKRLVTRHSRLSVTLLPGIESCCWLYEFFSHIFTLVYM